jgi:hypothetical protein
MLAFFSDLIFELIILTFLIIARKDTGCWPLVRDAISRLQMTKCKQQAGSAAGPTRGQEPETGCQ